MDTLEDLGQEYRRRFAALAPYREAVWRVLTGDFFQAYVRPDATVLDLGSGWGSSSATSGPVARSRWT